MTLVSSLFVQDDSEAHQQHSNNFAIIAATAVVAFSLAFLVDRLFHPKRPSILPRAGKNLSHNNNNNKLSCYKQQDGPSPSPPSSPLYPPDYFPGARDVPTPYGSIRCYEFGPTTGRKVLLLHGISTSCMTLTFLAHGLAERGGCRVLLFDLFGRGYSDGVGDLPYDERLFVSQALCVLASSELAWTGKDGCDVIGYSLGGGIAVHLATAFPQMVRSLVLLAPAGLIRKETFGMASRVVFRSGWVPEGVLEVITRWRLKRPIAASAKKRKQQSPASTTPTEEKSTLLPDDKSIEATVTSEIADPATPDPPNALQRKVLAYVSWQTNHHAGFINAFQSTVRFAPLMGQHEAYAKLAARKPRTVCFIFGDGDEIVNEEDYRHDALPLVGGEEHVVWKKSVRGAHDFPMVDPETTLRIMMEFWDGMK